VRGEPTADTARLQVGIELVGEFLIFGAVANEATVEIKCRDRKGFHMDDEVFWYAATLKEGFGYLAF
jgi:hypothetical protein